jgi:hypothetical protein
VSPWISTHIAAKMLGLTERHFRLFYCDIDHPKVITKENGKTGNKRRFQVFRANIEALKRERHRMEYGEMG